MREIVEQGVEPAEVAEAVHRAVVEGTLFVIPTTDVRDMIERRLQDVAEALPPR